MNLQREIEEASIAAGVGRKPRNFLDRILTDSFDLNPQLYYHVAHVLLMGVKAAKVVSLNPAIMYIAGGGHDAGKLYLDRELLEATHLSRAQYERIKEHALTSVEMLLSQGERIAAEMVRRIHAYATDANRRYPALTPYGKWVSSKEAYMISLGSQVHSVLDYYDAAVQRPDDFYGLQGPLKPEDTRPYIRRDRLIDPALIRTLFEYKVLNGRLTKQ